ncbi:SDR family oxidoreductase [Candidatus Acetothermia bacterium]|nr:SDR family oxidoreductase [Candidatus Acetothermia bacterium]MBI3643033.1 SDR family oxidoreductase [Candidatus Acetothermia bacterium]
MTKAIFVTGASSGIGYALATDLASKGHRVYATVRTPEDEMRLDQTENIYPLMLDVRDRAQIEESRRIIVGERMGLYGIVNNAGVGPIGPLHTFTDKEMLDLFETNVFGPFRMTNAFLDLLLESKGRIVNIGSQGGSVSMAYYGPYTMTKHALEAYSVALGAELQPYGVFVSIVQPGGIISEIGAKMALGNLTRFRRASPPFEEAAKQVIAALEMPTSFDVSKPESATNRNPSSPDIVIEAVTHALFSEHPKPRYLVGTRWEGNRVINMLLERLADVNQCKTLQYSRDELVDWLDKKLSECSD